MESGTPPRTPCAFYGSLSHLTQGRTQPYKGAGHALFFPRAMVIVRTSSDPILRSLLHDDSQHLEFSLQPDRAHRRETFLPHSPRPEIFGWDDDEDEDIEFFDDEDDEDDADDEDAEEAEKKDDDIVEDEDEEFGDDDDDDEEFEEEEDDDFLDKDEDDDDDDDKDEDLDKK